METITQTLISLIPSLLAVVGVYVNLTRDVERLRGRVFSLESDRDEVKQLVKECIEGIQDLKVLLAKKGI